MRILHRNDAKAPKYPTPSRQRRPPKRWAVCAGPKHGMKAHKLHAAKRHRGCIGGIQSSLKGQQKQMGGSSSFEAHLAMGQIPVPPVNIPIPTKLD